MDAYIGSIGLRLKNFISRCYARIPVPVEALRAAIPRMIKVKRYHRKYFIASISPAGEVRILWDYKNDRAKSKTKQLALRLP